MTLQKESTEHISHPDVDSYELIYLVERPIFPNNASYIRGKVGNLESGIIDLQDNDNNTFYPFHNEKQTI